MFIPVLLLALAFVYLLVNVILVVIRNYKAHQFFKIKSPKLPVIGKPNIFHGHTLTVMSEKNWKIITDLHEKLGPTFGYFMCNQPWVSTKDLDLIKLIELDQANKHTDRSKYGIPFKEFNKSIFQVNGDDWRLIRRIISPALTNHKVRSDEVSSDIENVLQQLIEGLESRLNEAQTQNGHRSVILDIGNMFERYTLAVIFLVTYKQDGQINFINANDEWVDKMDRAARLIKNPFIIMGMIFPFLRPTCDFLTRLHLVGRVRIQIIDYITQATNINKLAREEHQKTQRRLSKETDFKEQSFSKLKQSGRFKRRLVDTIIDAFVEKKINYDNFVGTLVFLLLAGFETTADTMTCLVWNLTWHPEIQEKLRKEVAENGMDCEYMLWCIQETIRWHPAVPLGVGRILGEDVTVNGTFLAKGTFVMPSTYSIHHDSKIWPNADKFMPERWQDAADFHPAAFMGFGLGPRNCVGGKLAVHEIKVAISALLTRYRFETCADTAKEYAFTSPGWLYTNLDQPIKIRLVALDS